MSDTLQKQAANNRPIQVLSPQLANQIAAGEVVERPASVVKELVENSIDANATQIHIEIDQGGQKRILIRDNGDGISKEQLSLALSRHATSKIANFDDLERITSMGFRGEALASISSVSRLSLCSKPKLQTEAWQAVAEGQQMDVQITPAAHPDGTSIEVLDLFFNTPARRKFLRTGKTEFQHIENIVKRIALTRPNVQFVLVHNQKVCCRYNAVNTLSKRIEQVCGKKLLAQCVHVEYQYEGIHLQAWCSKLGFGVATRDYQYTFVNDRMMKDKLLSHALRQVYEDTLPPQTFCAYVLYLTVPPEQLDVNVHPAKHEVRFHQARQIHDLVFKAINDAIGHGLDMDSVTQATHDYITPLEASTQNERANISSVGHSATQYSGGGRGYQSNVPSRGQIRASNEFYQSVHDTTPSIIGTFAVNNNPEVQQESKASREQDIAASFVSNECLYVAPYLVFPAPEKLSVLHIKYLLKLLIEQRISQSTIAQALLMPVSVNKADINTDNFDNDLDVNNKLDIEKSFSQLQQSHFLLSLSHQKVLLKQVPSELRHLPWANIFPQLNFVKVLISTDSAGLNERFQQEIARAWFTALMHQSEGISPSILAAWLKEIDQVRFQLEVSKQAKSLQLHEWMQHE